MNRLETMAQMLTYRRPHRSRTERRFIKKYISDLEGVKHDKFGNRIVRIGDAPILYSCHTDSVHSKAGFQTVAVKGTSFSLSPREIVSSCLGADDAAGIWLMREMILAKKPGLYIFHRGEEVGCTGSKFIASQTPTTLKDIKAAIAFDRRGTKSIITHQIGGRCCSDAFANSLSAEMKLKHIKDSTGTFTDTAQYVDLVGECTNVSIGFSGEHTTTEELEMSYLLELREAMLNLNWENLAFSRKPGERTYKTYYNGYKSHKLPTIYLPKEPLMRDGHEMDLELSNHELMIRMVRTNPSLIVTMMTDYGISADDIADFIDERGGYVPYELILNRPAMG